MTQKTPLSFRPDENPVDRGASGKSLIDVEIYPTRADRRPNRLEPETRLARVPIEAIEELNQAQQLLANAIELAISLPEARLKTAAAWSVMEEIDHLRPQMDRAKWRELSAKLREMTPLEEWRGDATSTLSQSIERFWQAREDALRRANNAVGLLGSDRSKQSAAASPDVEAMLSAMSELQEAGNACAICCARESRYLANEISNSVKNILHQLERQQASISAQSDEFAGGKVKSGPAESATASSPGLAKANETFDNAY
ncbi:MAG: hypothetical protein ACTHKT_05065 [Solirubrobacterales bacterium]